MYKWTSMLAVLLLAAVMLVGCSSDPMSSNSEQYLPLENTNATTRGAQTASSAVTITSATLHLWVSEFNNLNVNVHRVTSDWDEMTVTWNNFGGAFDPTILTSMLVDGWGVETADVTATVQAWMDGTLPNYGFLLDMDPFDTPRAVFYTRELADREPYLVICYEENGMEMCDTLISMADTYIYEIRPDINRGDGRLMYVGWNDETDLEKQSLVRFMITPPPPDTGGCSHTIGYWKTHAGFGPQADEVSQYLPIWLGDMGGAESIQVTTAGMAVDILDMNVYGEQSNGITKLMGQLLGTKLSIADGASDMDVAATIAAADAFLADYSWEDWDSLTNAQRGMVNDWQEMLDDYNNGIIGPGHCDEFEEEEEEEDEGDDD